MNRISRVSTFAILAATLAISAPAIAEPPRCAQAVACEKAQAMFLQQRGLDVLHRAQDLPPDLVATLAASTGSRLIANRMMGHDGLQPVASAPHRVRIPEHHFSLVSSDLAATVYRPIGTRSDQVLLLFTRGTEEPVCRLHLNRPVESAQDIRWTLQRDFGSQSAIYSDCTAADE